MKSVSFESILPLIEEAFVNEQTITIPVTGTSMMPLLRPKDAVTLAPIDRKSIQRGDILLYRRSNGAFVLHRVVNVQDNTVDFCGDNQVEVESSVPITQLIARVISYEKDGKTTLLNDIRREGSRRLQSRPVRAAATKYHSFRTSKRSRAEMKRNWGSYRHLLTYLKPHIWRIVLMCVCSSISSLATLGMAFASGRVIDKALGNDMHDFARWFWVLFALMLLVAVGSIVYSNIRTRAVGKLRNEIRADIFSQLLDKQYISIFRIHSGEILNRLTSDLQIVADNSVTLVPQLFGISIKLIGGLVFMFTMEPVFTSLLIAGSLILAASFQFFGRYFKSMHKLCQETEGRTRSYIQECLENIVVIKSFTNNVAVSEKLGVYQEDGLNKQIKRNFYSNIANTTLYMAFTFSYYAGLAWGVLRIAGVIGTVPMSVGLFATLLQIMEQIRTPFRSATGVAPQVMSMLASAERLYDLLRMPDETVDSDSKPIQNNAFQALKLSNVHFSYEEDRFVLNNASLLLEKGSFTVLLGMSGIGKTTIIKLLLGLVQPQIGDIVFETENGVVPVSAMTRHMFAYVPQGNMLLSGTLRENILFGNRRVSSEQLNNVLKLSCLDEVVVSLPNGLDSMIGERGFGLSEGQLQRIAIARALLSPAPILLLDECTSALDAATEQRLLENLRSLTDRTIFFISHRPAVLQSADRVFTIENGEILQKL